MSHPHPLGLAAPTVRVGAVDGLRGLALLLVVAFHLFGQGRVSGGVDVFLVLSGYFATGALLRRAEGGTLRLAAHYARTLARLLPAALVVLAAVTVALLTLAPRLRWSAGLREVGASATSWQNWELVSSSLAYGAAGPDASPLQHFWSLSVQGQFFAAWPLVVLGLVAIARRGARAGRTRLTPRGLVTAVTAATSAASFAYALWLVGVDKPVAYFSTFTRFWEIGVGALLALTLPRAVRAATRRGSSRPGSLITGPARTWAGWAGLALVVGSGFLVDGADVFPGAWALVPVGGAALVLAATVAGPTTQVPGPMPQVPGPTTAAAPDPASPPEPPRPRGVERLLDSAPLRLGARFSYALYLWHWPVLVFWLLTTGYRQAGPLAAVAILAISAVLAWLTTRYVAEPLLAHVTTRLAARRSARSGPAPADRTSYPAGLAATLPSGRRTLAVLAGAAVLVLGGAQAAATAHDETVRQNVTDLLAPSPDHPGAAALVPDRSAAQAPDAQDQVGREHAAQHPAPPDPTHPGPADPATPPPPFRPATWVAYDDHPDRPDCAQGGDRSELLECVVVDQADPTAVVYLAGASHEQQYEEAFAALAREHGWELREMLKHGCRLATPDDGEDPAGPVPPPSCVAWNERALAALVAARPDAVVVVGSRTYEDGAPEEVLPGQVGAWRTLADAGIRVVTIRDNPRFEWFVPECLDRADVPEDCARPRAEQLAAVSPVPTAPGVPATAVHLDLSDAVCGPEVCDPVVGNVLVYRDDDHLTNTYVRTLAPVVGRQLRPGAPWLFESGRGTGPE